MIEAVLGQTEENNERKDGKYETDKKMLRTSVIPYD